MLDLRLRAVRCHRLAAMASSAALFGVLILLPFYLTAVLGFSPVQLALAISPIAGSFVLVAPLAGRAMMPVGNDRLAATGFLIAAGGAVWTGLAAPSQDYAAVLPGILAFGVGWRCRPPRSPRRPSTRCRPPGWASPRRCRRSAATRAGARRGHPRRHPERAPAGLEQALGRVAPEGRELVAEGFRTLRWSPPASWCWPPSPRRACPPWRARAAPVLPPPLDAPVPL
jgi:hypothetical protein